MIKHVEKFELLFDRPTRINGPDFIEIDDKDSGMWVTLWNDGRICIGATIDNERDMENIAKEANGFGEAIDEAIDYYSVSMETETDLDKGIASFKKLKQSLDVRS